MTDFDALISDLQFAYQGNGDVRTAETALREAIAALEAEYEEAMQFILAVNQPHDFDCANYMNPKKNCDCGYQKLVDVYLSKRGQG